MSADRWTTQIFRSWPFLAGSSRQAGSFGGIRASVADWYPGVWPDDCRCANECRIQFDFAGGFPEAQNGASFGIMRLRTGTIRFDWTNTSLVGGQDSLFFAPFSPTSIATLGIPAMAYSGNLWSWTPQVRVEHKFTSVGLLYLLQYKAEFWTI